jgi:hypothetical protein
MTVSNSSWLFDVSVSIHAAVIASGELALVLITALMSVSAVCCYVLQEVQLFAQPQLCFVSESITGIGCGRPTWCYEKAAHTAVG